MLCRPKIFIFLYGQLNYYFIFFLWRIFVSHSQKTYPQLIQYRNSFAAIVAVSQIHQRNPLYCSE